MKLKNTEITPKDLFEKDSIADILDPETGEVKTVQINKEGTFNCLVQKDATSNKFEINILASTPDIDRMGDIVEPDAFKSSLQRFKDVGVILYQHDPNRPIGHPIEASIGADGLNVKAFISETAQDVRKLVEEGILKQASIGFRILDHEFKKIGENVIFIIKDLELLEVSLVSVAANPSTSVSIAKSFYSEIPEEVVEEKEAAKEVEVKEEEVDDKEEINEEVKEEEIEETKEVIQDTKEEVEEEIDYKSLIDSLATEVTSLKSQLTELIEENSEQIEEKSVSNFESEVTKQLLEIKTLLNTDKE